MLATSALSCNLTEIVLSGHPKEVTQTSGVSGLSRQPTVELMQRSYKECLAEVTSVLCERLTAPGSHGEVV